MVILQRRQQQIFLALEVLVEGSLADAHIGQDRVDRHVAESIAVEPLKGGADQALSRVGRQRGISTCYEVYGDRRVGCTTSQPAGVPRVNLPDGLLSIIVVRSRGPTIRRPRPIDVS